MPRLIPVNAQSRQHAFAGGGDAIAADLETASEEAAMSEPLTKTDKPGKEKTVSATAAGRSETGWEPMIPLRQEMERFFDSFWRGFGMALGRHPTEQAPGRWPYSGAVPAIDVVENDKEWRLSAELPGLSAKDIEVSVDQGILTFKGEKHEERDEKSENYHLSERRFGYFKRSFDVPPGTDAEHIEAKFDKGVLSIRIPKLPEAAASQRKIEVKEAG